MANSLSVQIKYFTVKATQKQGQNAKRINYLDVTMKKLKCH